MIIEFGGAGQHPRVSRKQAGESDTRRRAVLRDGSKVLIRQVRSTDALLLADGFARLSAQSRRMRFLTDKARLSVAELRYLTNVDHHDHEALGALSDADGRGVGIARFIRDTQDTRAAEIAVTIVDEWQGRGLGTELLAGLSQRARQAGIRRFTTLVAEDNIAVTGLLRNAGGTLVSRGPGTFEYEIVLTPEAEHSLDLWFRSAAASARCGTGLRSWTCWRRNCTPGLRAPRRS